jgi:hypothetical protein
MAKQAVGTVERHVEKGVLALCGIGLLATVALYLVKSPNQADVGGDAVGPDGVYEAVARQGERLRINMLDAKEDVEPTEDRSTEMELWLRKPLVAGQLDPKWRAPVPPLPSVPDIGTRPIGDGVQLAQLLPPSGVRAAVVGRSVAYVEPPEILGEGARRDEGIEEYRASFNWVTVSGVYDRLLQERVFRDANYSAGRRDHYIVGVDLQRRERRWDGSYTEWKDVPTWAPVKAPAPPRVRVVDTQVTKAIDPNMRPALDAYTELVRYPLSQLALMRPPFPYHEAGDYWALPVYEGIDIEALDEEYYRAAGEEPQDRYADSLGDVSDDDRREPDNDMKIEGIRARVDQGFANADEAQLILDEVEELLADPNLRSTLVAELEDLQSRIEQIMEAGQYSGGPVGAPRSPKEVVWAFDLMPQSVRSGQTYQYRMRLRFYNRYCVFPADLETPTDAEQVVVASEWSEPTDEVIIPKDAEFFVTSANKGVVKAEIYKWVEGDWVKQSFELNVGLPISGRKRMRLPSQPDRGTQRVEFDTGATVLEIDLQRPYEDVNRTSDGGFQVKAAATTAAVVYVDAEGQLRERLLAWDKDSEERKWYRKLTQVRRARSSEPKAPPTAPPRGGPPRGGPPYGGGRR